MFSELDVVLISSQISWNIDGVIGAFIAVKYGRILSIITLEMIVNVEWWKYIVFVACIFSVLFVCAFNMCDIEVKNKYWIDLGNKSTKRTTLTSYPYQRN